MTIDEIYLKIAQQIVDAIDGKWEVAIINAQIHVDSAEFDCVFKEDENSDIEFDFDIEFDMLKAFECLRKITTEDGMGSWNLVKFTLYPSGEFSVDFNWDEDLVD